MDEQGLNMKDDERVCKRERKREWMQFLVITGSPTHTPHQYAEYANWLAGFLFVMDQEARGAETTKHYNSNHEEEDMQRQGGVQRKGA